MFEIINAVVPDASVADFPALKASGNKILLVRGTSTFFINGKLAVNYCIRKLRNPPSWLVIFLVVPFNKNSSIF